MLGIVTAAIGLASEIFKMINTNSGRKYIDELKEIKEDLLAEESKGYDSDDAKIENLYQRVKIVLEAAQSEVELYKAKK